MFWEYFCSYWSLHTIILMQILQGKICHLLFFIFLDVKWYNGFKLELLKLLFRLLHVLHVFGFSISFSIDDDDQEDNVNLVIAILKNHLINLTQFFFISPWIRAIDQLEHWNDRPYIRRHSTNRHTHPYTRYFIYIRLHYAEYGRSTMEPNKFFVHTNKHPTNNNSKPVWIKKKRSPNKTLM